MKFVNIILPLLTIAAASCSKEESIVYKTDFSGEENRLASFALVTDEGKSYSATLYNDEILMVLPSDVNLETLKPQYLLAENTSLQPDPANVKDWGSEQRFLATSYSGQQRVYTYRLSLVESENPQTVILATQADVDAFGKSGQTHVTGNLIIGMTPDGYDDKNTVLPITNCPITSLSALSKLRQVDGELIIYPTYTGSNIEGLNAVETLGGLRISVNENCTPLQSIYFPSLRHVSNNLVMSTNKLQDADFPVLESIGGNFDLVTADLQLLKVPSLETIGGWLRLDGSLFKIPTGFPTVNPLSAIEFPRLRSVLYIYIYWYESVTTMNFESLESVEDILIYWCSIFSDFSTFANIVPTLDAEHWTVEGNGYNPSWQDMAEGRYTKQ